MSLDIITCNECLDGKLEDGSDPDNVGNNRTCAGSFKGKLQHISKDSNFATSPFSYYIST